MKPEAEWPMPIFKLYTEDGEIDIYANGLVEGCPNLFGIMNLIPDALRPGVLPYFSKSRQLESPTRRSLNKTGGMSQGEAS